MSNTFVVETKTSSSPITSVMLSGDQVRILRERKGWSQEDLAKAIGVSQAAIQKIESGDTKRSKYLTDIADALEVPWEATNKGITETALKVAQAYGYQPPRPNASPPVYQRLPAGRLPILGRAAGGSSGRFLMNGERVGTTFMPSSLEGVDGAYAVYVHGTSMETRYFNGEVVWINPYLPVAQNDFVVAQLAPMQDGEPLDAYVKQFVSRNSRELVLRQLNPPEGEDELMRFPEARVFSVHKIIMGGSP